LAGIKQGYNVLKSDYSHLHTSKRKSFLKTKSNSMAKRIRFNVEVNPFLQKATITTEIDGVSYTIIRHYNEIDEWDSFEINGQVHDIHFCYDSEFSVSIYPVIKDVADFENPYKVKLKIVLKD